MRVAISGITGLVGNALRESLGAEGVELVALTRRKSLPPLPTVTWDVEKGRFDAGSLEGVDAVVHLAGAPVAQRWTSTTKHAIRDSRVKSTELIVEGLKSLKRRPKVLVSASAVGYYGDGGEKELIETSPAGTGFLSDVCRAWEHAAMEAMGLGIRTVVIRTGIVLSTRGGALKKMLLPFRLGLGGPVGSGKQWMPWIHIDDTVGAIRFLFEKDELMGAVNLMAPNPARNEAFSRSLAGVLRRPAILPAPAFGLKLAFGEMSEILLEGQRAVPAKLQEAGYPFRFPELKAAIEDVLRNDK
ncbi:MAG TPA: TIGR01777 family oxidoreductase [Vicinamibacteria bacterium]|nr:TIGR01777 family oxidoreductase [Vicinamibacteria bacterium]